MLICNGLHFIFFMSLSTAVKAEQWGFLEEVKRLGGVRQKKFYWIESK
jgi:hypothetical protein